MEKSVAVGLGLMEFPFSGAKGFWRWVDLCEAGGVDSLWQTDRLISREPILEADWVEAHATVVAVGSDGGEKRELSAGLMGRADKIVVDSISQCVRLGELHHAVEDGAVAAESVHGELGEVLTNAKPGREGGELIVCDLTGLGAQDAAIAEEAWRVVRPPESAAS